MEFGRFGFARSRGLFALTLVLVGGGDFKARAQQAQSSSSGNTAPGSAAPALPGTQPVSQAAMESAGASADSGKTGASGASSNSVSAGESSSLLRLGAGGLLEVGVYNVPELSTKARVGTTGDVYLPLIDYVHVGDLTVEEAQALIEKRLEDGGFVRNPHVTIFLDESASQGVTILGEVSRPGIYPAIGDRRLYDLISAAGGFTPSAGRRGSIIPHNQR